MPIDPLQTTVRAAVRAAVVAAAGVQDYEPTAEDAQRIASAVAAFLRAIPPGFINVPSGLDGSRIIRLENLTAAVEAAHD